MKILQASRIAFILGFLISCNLKHHSALPPEFVLTNGMIIKAYTPNGQITIEGKDGFTRSYTGENLSKTSVLIPRNTRWSGSLGLYDPADSNTLGDRLLIDEGKQFFSSESEALRYMQSLSSYYGPLTYNNQGLVIAYKVISIPNEKPTRSLAIWQFYINGTRPTALRGAVDKNIEIIGGTISDKATPNPAPEGYQRELAKQEYDPGK